MGARIIGTGSAVPPTCLTNADMEKRVATTNEWIVTRTGIEEPAQPSQPAADGLPLDREDPRG